MNFKKTLDNYKNQLNNELSSLLVGKMEEAENGFLKETYKNLKDYVLNGGKRLRPIALIMAYLAVNGKNASRIISASASVELLHNSTLIHDDVMDEDESRRDKATIHKKMREWFLAKSPEVRYAGHLFDRTSSRFAVTNAVCDGNILFTLGLRSILDSGFGSDLIKEAAAVYSDAYKIVNDGQIMDNQFELESGISEKEYLVMIEKKTANLFLASIQIGAILGNANKEQYDALSSFAKLVAGAFQLQDDIMSIDGSLKERHGSDIRKGKKTLLVIKAIESANAKQKKLIEDVLGKDDASTEDVNSVISVIEDVGAMDYVKNLALKRIEQGKTQLIKAKLKKEAEDFFIELADYMAARKK